MNFMLHRTVALLSCLLLSGFLFTGCKEKQPAGIQSESAVQKVSGTSKLLVTIPDTEKPQGREESADHASDKNQEKPAPEFFIKFSDTGNSVVYIAKIGDGVRLVLNGKPGKTYKEINDFKLAFSPDGEHVAYGARVDDSWRMVVDGKEYGPYENVGPPVFSPDGKHIAYEVQKRGMWHIAVDHTGLSAPCESFFEKPYFSADSSRIAYVVNADKNGKMRLVVSGLDFKNPVVHEYEMVYVEQNAAKTHVASTVKTADNKMRVVLIDLQRPETVKESAPYNELRNLAFSKEGSLIAFAATRSSVNYLVFNDKEERFPEATGVVGMTVIRPDNSGASLLMADKKGAFVYNGFVAKQSRGKQYADAGELVFSKDGTSIAHTALIGNLWKVVVNGKESSAGYDAIVSLQFTPDGNKVVFRARKGAKRFVVVADAATAGIIREHPGYERVFEPEVSVDSATVGYGVKDGNQLWWKVESL